MHRRLVSSKTVADLPRKPYTGGKIYPQVIPLSRIYCPQRECERPNYIPYSTHDERGSHRIQQSPYIDPKVWCHAYTRQLNDMYRIVRLVVSRNYPSRQIDWNKNAHAFAKLMFHCSSKYISPYVEEYDSEEYDSEEYEGNNTSKEVEDKDKGWEKQEGN